MILYLFKDLRRHLWRTVTGITGYIVGVLFILLLLSVTKTGDDGSLKILKGTGTHFIAYVPSNTSCCVSHNPQTSGSSLVAEGVYSMMMNSDVLVSIEQIKGVRAAAPYLLYNIYDKKYQASITLGGIDPESIATQNNVCAATNLVSGTFLTGKTEEVLAEESFARALKLKPGDTLLTFGGKLVVAGVVNSGIKPGKADLYGTISNVRKILKEDLSCISDGFDMNIVLVEVEDARSQPQVMRSLKEQMGHLTLSSYNCYQPASDVMNITTGTRRLFMAVILLFLVIFAAKNQLTSLMERFRETGILKSLGWSDYRLGLHIVLSSAFQALAGSAAAIMLAILLIALINALGLPITETLQFTMQYSMIPRVVLLAMAGGLAASVFPVFRLFRSAPGEMINQYL